MKIKKINSINYGGKVIGVGLAMMFPIPGILAVLYFIWENAYALFVAKISFALGELILGLFFVC